MIDLTMRSARKILVIIVAIISAVFLRMILVEMNHPKINEAQGSRHYTPVHVTDELHENDDKDNRYQTVAVNGAQAIELGPKLTAHAQCTPSTNIVYIKVHKTGSSTLQNIFYRFGDERDLTFALPNNGFYIEGVGQLKPNTILSPPPGKHYNILANHARFFYDDMKKMMPGDTKFVTLIREAASHFTSMYTYFVMKRQYKVELDQFSLNPRQYYDQYNKNKMTRQCGKDPELFDLGIDKQILYDQRKVDEYIQYLDSKMDLVLLSEHFFESLILLKDLMCWDLRTIVHLNSKLRVYYNKKTGANVTEAETKKAEALTKRLNEWNGGDHRLYDHFNRTLWRKVDEYGRARMETEIMELKDLCKRYEEECMSGTKVRDISYWSGPYGVTEYVLRKEKAQNKTCQRLGMSEPEFVPYLRQKHKARMLKH